MLLLLLMIMSAARFVLLLGDRLTRIGLLVVRDPLLFGSFSCFSSLVKEFVEVLRIGPFHSTGDTVRAAVAFVTGQ